MIVRGTTGCSWVTWSLLAVWLSLGCVGLAEQLHLWDETTTQDEAALDELAFAIKPDTSPVDEGGVRWAIPVITLPSPPLSTWNRSESLSDIHPPKPALRPHQQYSVYRI